MNSRQRRRRRWEEKKRRDRRSTEEYKHEVFEIKEELKKLPKLNGLKLIYLTGKKERRRVKRGLRSRVFSRREVQKTSPQPSCPEVPSSHDIVASSATPFGVTGDVPPDVLDVTDDEEDDDSSLAGVSKTSGLFRFLCGVITALSASRILLLFLLWMLPLAEAVESSPVRVASNKLRSRQRTELERVWRKMDAMGADDEGRPALEAEIARLKEEHEEQRMSQIKTKPFDSQQYTPPSRKKKNKNKGKNKGKGKGKGRSHRHGGARKRKRLTYGEVSNSYSTAQLQCDTGSKEAEVKIRKMLNKHMVGPKDSDSLLSVLLATPTAKTPSVEKFLSHCRYMRHKGARTM